ncbi:hypothetical protein CYJ16_07980 [Actinotignum timonense]|nr:methyltransferase [Actinotignum schaalii]PLB83662.1 hypothetical protein CYJ16_07980 [Actinotignum timonense]
MCSVPDGALKAKAMRSQALQSKAPKAMAPETKDQRASRTASSRFCARGFPQHGRAVYCYGMELFVPGAPERLATTLRQDLTGYTTTHISTLLGPEATAAMRREQRIPALLVCEKACHQATAPHTEAEILACQVRLLILGDTLSAAELEGAFPATFGDRVTRDALLVIGNAGYRARFQVVPVPLDITRKGTRRITRTEVLIASDFGELAGRVPGAHHVMPVGGATRTLANIVTYTGGRVLDVGTGCGIHAISAALHGCEVVATDISARALQFASLNIALAAVRVELLQGSLFDPVEGRFDTIVSNPPFVITPASVRQKVDFEYRDGGFGGDTLLSELISALPAHLTDTGTAYILGNWEVEDGCSWDTHPQVWARVAGLDAWFIARDDVDPAHYVEMWLRDGGLRPRDAGYEDAYRTWLDDFAARGIRAISLGYGILSRPAAAREPMIRTEEIPGRPQGDIRQHIQRVWNNRHLVAAPDEDLAQRHLTRTEVIEHRFYDPGAADPLRIVLAHTGGFQQTLPADSQVAAFVGACDGELSVGALCQAIAQIYGEDSSAVQARLLETVRELIATGLLTEGTGMGTGTGS